jgi:hypothetical protein
VLTLYGQVMDKKAYRIRSGSDRHIGSGSDRHIGSDPYIGLDR